MNTYKLYKEINNKQIYIVTENEWEEIERGRADTVEYVGELKSNFPDYRLVTGLKWNTAVMLAKSEEKLKEIKKMIEER